MSKIRISKLFGSHVVEMLDNNGVWVAAEPGSDTFTAVAEAQDYVDGWLENNPDMEQVEGIEK